MFLLWKNRLLDFFGIDSYFICSEPFVYMLQFNIYCSCREIRICSVFIVLAVKLGSNKAFLL